MCRDMAITQPIEPINGNDNDLSGTCHIRNTKQMHTFTIVSVEDVMKWIRHCSMGSTEPTCFDHIHDTNSIADNYKAEHKQQTACDPAIFYDCYYLSEIVRMRTSSSLNQIQMTISNTNNIKFGFLFSVLYCFVYLRILNLLKLYCWKKKQIIVSHTVAYARKRRSQISMIKLDQNWDRECIRKRDDRSHHGNFQLLSENSESLCKSTIIMCWMCFLLFSSVCLDRLAIKSAKPAQGIFTPCVAFRVAGMPMKHINSK